MDNCNKISFATKAEARANANFQRKDGRSPINKRLRPYQCPHCGQWHNTSSTGARQKKLLRRHKRQVKEMEQIKRARPKRFSLPTGDLTPARKREAVARHIKALTAEKPWQIVITEGEPRRHKVQNDLIWAWNKELTTAHAHADYKANDYHAFNKLHVLLPLMVHEWDRWKEEGRFLHDILIHTTTRRRKCALPMIASGQRR